MLVTFFNKYSSPILSGAPDEFIPPKFNDVITVEGQVLTVQRVSYVYSNTSSRLTAAGFRDDEIPCEIRVYCE